MRKRRKRSKARKQKNSRRLPRSKERIESEIEALIPRLSEDPPPEVVSEDAAGRTVTIGPNMKKLLLLQQELFKAVFGREQGPNDLLFWNRDREGEGVFPIDEEGLFNDLRRNASAVGVRPDMAYATNKTGMIITEKNHHMFSEEDKRRWEEALKEYKRLQ